MEEYKGVIAATSSFIIWGLLPIYWKLLELVPAYEIFCHRMIWSFVITLVLLACMSKFNDFLQLFHDRKNIFFFTLTALLLSVNWFIYIWSVNSGFIIETSLGYYINPLVSVCFGVVFLKEKVRAVQWLAILIALGGVCYLTWSYGQFPWIALSLASTFAIYGLLRKITPVPSLEGLCLETAMLFLPAFGYLVFLEAAGTGNFLSGGTSQLMLLIGAGLVTSVPLLLFCYAAQKIPLFLIGILQYLGPTIGLLVGVFLYHEEFPPERMIGFMIIWVALALFLGEGLVKQIRAHRTKLKVV